MGPVIAAARNYRRLVEDGRMRRPWFSPWRSSTRCAGRSMPSSWRSRVSRAGCLRPIIDRGYDRGSRRARTSSRRGGRPSIGQGCGIGDGVFPRVLRRRTPPPRRASAIALVAALKAALDGEALPVLPPLQRVAATTPLLEPSPPQRQPIARGMGDGAGEGRAYRGAFRGPPWRAHGTVRRGDGRECRGRRRARR